MKSNWPKGFALVALLLLAGCGGRYQPAAGPVEIDILAFNDFHGHLEPPGIAPPVAGETRPAGGVAQLAAAVKAARAENPNSLVVSAGDMVGASPLVSSLFLDEPTIAAMNLVGLDYNAVGNHEFDRGTAELLRLQRGGCEKVFIREPCGLDGHFPGAKFGFLAANVRTRDGKTLFPAYALRRFARVTVGIIGLTLEGTPLLVTPAGVEGLRFEDEAETINALVPTLKSEGADAIVVVIHQGVDVPGGGEDGRCDTMTGELKPILDRLDPAVDVVVSGHTHKAYICDYGRPGAERPLLLTSAGLYGTMLTHIRLSIDPAGGVVSVNAVNRLVPADGPSDPAVAALVQRYAAAAEPMAARVVGRIAGPVTRQPGPGGGLPLAELIADAQLAAARMLPGGADVAFMNRGGVRADLVPDAEGRVTFAQLFAVQPFGNGIVLKRMSGRKIRALLEEQLADRPGAGPRPLVLHPSRDFTYSYDLSRPAGSRIVDMRLAGAPIDEARDYRIAVNSFLASGGDGLSLLAGAETLASGAVDLDALEALVARGVEEVPKGDRIVRLDEAAAR